MKKRRPDDFPEILTEILSWGSCCGCEIAALIGIMFLSFVRDTTLWLAGAAGVGLVCGAIWLGGRLRKRR